MTPEGLQSLAKNTLGAELCRSGRFIYSAAATLRPGDVYLLGTNPGGDPNNPKHGTLGDEIEAFPSRVRNAYLDETWSKSPNRLQLGVRWLLPEIGLDARKVCASNLIFFRGEFGKQVFYPKDAELCWPLHEAVLHVVKPLAIIAFGNGDGCSPYSYLREFKFRQHGEESSIHSGHGEWECKCFLTTFADRAMAVIGLPHLSRYKVERKTDIALWIRSIISIIRNRRQPA